MKIRQKFLLLIVFAGLLPAVNAQGPLNDERVLLQGFYWESYRHGHPEKFPVYGSKKWYVIVGEQAAAIKAARFDMVWLPPPSFAGTYSAGYNPKEYFNLNNSYGSLAQQRTMLKALLQNGIESLADIVINHRDGTTGWVGFKNPAWGLWSICGDDEAFSNMQSGVADTPLNKRGAPEEIPLPYAPLRASTFAYPSFRDIDHTSKPVEKDIIRYLLQLKSAGYRGWRYDMVHGYHAKWIGLYNKATHPTFSVGEYDWDKQGEQRGWIWYTSTTANHLETSSSVFDFSTFFTLKDHKADYPSWYGFGNGLGLVGDNTDGLEWKQRAVTFLENHDTGFRTGENGQAEEGHTSDSFLNNAEVEQGYAYILTHPGLPTVYWKHFFDWGPALQAKIKALINARKVAGVHSGSKINTQDNARQKQVYAAMVEGKNGELYVRIGGSDTDWQPSFSNYTGYREYAAGAGWKVWVKIPGNLPVQKAPFHKPYSVPVYRPATDIAVDDSLLKLLW